MKNFLSDLIKLGPAQNSDKKSEKSSDSKKKSSRSGGGRKGGGDDEDGKSSGGDMKILRKGMAMRVIFFYPGEEGTYVDHSEVTLYENGIVHIKSNQEETTTHLQNCEILWRFEQDADDRTNKVRLLKPAKSKGGASESRLSSKDDQDSELRPDSKDAKSVEITETNDTL